MGRGVRIFSYDCDLHFYYLLNVCLPGVTGALLQNVQYTLNVQNCQLAGICVHLACAEPENSVNGGPIS